MTEEEFRGTVGHTPSPPQAEDSDKILRDMFARGLAVLHAHVPAGRERSLAITKIEESEFWARKGASADTVTP